MAIVWSETMLNEHYRQISVNNRGKQAIKLHAQRHSMVFLQESDLFVWSHITFDWYAFLHVHRKIISLYSVITNSYKLGFWQYLLVNIFSYDSLLLPLTSYHFIWQLIRSTSKKENQHLRWFDNHTTEIHLVVFFRECIMWMKFN